MVERFHFCSVYEVAPLLNFLFKIMIHFICIQTHNEHNHRNVNSNNEQILKLIHVVRCAFFLRGGHPRIHLFEKE